MTWTRFMDMHSGGGLKEGSYNYILIQAPESEAKIIFYNRFGHNPERVSCTCCGDDYSISEEEFLDQITAYDRNCASAYFYKDDGTEAAKVRGFSAPKVKYNYDTKRHEVGGREVEFKYVERPNLHHMKYGASKAECVARYKTVAEYVESGDVLVISEEDIEPHERIGSVPESGYVWID